MLNSFVSDLLGYLLVYLQVGLAQQTVLVGVATLEERQREGVIKHELANHRALVASPHVARQPGQPSAEPVEGQQRSSSALRAAAAFLFGPEIPEIR